MAHWKSSPSREISLSRPLLPANALLCVCCSARSFDPPTSLGINTLPRRSASSVRAEQHPRGRAALLSSWSPRISLSPMSARTLSEGDFAQDGNSDNQRDQPPPIHEKFRDRPQQHVLEANPVQSWFPPVTKNLLAAWSLYRRGEHPDRDESRLGTEHIVSDFPFMPGSALQKLAVFQVAADSPDAPGRRHQ